MHVRFCVNVFVLGECSGRRRRQR